MSQKDEIRTFVHQLLQRRGIPDGVSDGEALLTSGLLDSLDVLEIATFLEESFGLDFADGDFDAGDFDTIDAIASRLDPIVD